MTYARELLLLLYLSLSLSQYASILASLAFPALPHSSSAFTVFTCPNEKCFFPVSVLPRGRKKIGT
ncbi:hypothetical protein HMPREF1986_02579 [Oribacterium sp. oral taxon 078 str. F0263]|nr:hypothetical protein HMPREF1986_02579 [Oribacterium sp. oral taxon 078 str. F0263]